MFHASFDVFDRAIISNVTSSMPWYIVNKALFSLFLRSLSYFIASLSICASFFALGLTKLSSISSHTFRASRRTFIYMHMHINHSSPLSIKRFVLGMHQIIWIREEEFLLNVCIHQKTYYSSLVSNTHIEEDKGTKHGFI